MVAKFGCSSTSCKPPTQLFLFQFTSYLSVNCKLKYQKILDHPKHIPIQSLIYQDVCYLGKSFVCSFVFPFRNGLLSFKNSRRLIAVINKAIPEINHFNRDPCLDRIGTKVKYGNANRISQKLKQGHTFLSIIELPVFLSK